MSPLLCNGAREEGEVADIVEYSFKQQGYGKKKIKCRKYNVWRCTHGEWGGVLHICKCNDAAIEDCLQIEQQIAYFRYVRAVVEWVRLLAIVEHAFGAFHYAAAVHQEYIGHSHDVEYEK